MTQFHVVCDSTADLDPPTAAALGVTVVPLRVIFGEEEYLDGPEMSTAEFYRRMQVDPHHPRTSQPTPAEFEAAFRRVGSDGGSIICSTISSGLSGTYGSAMQARAALPDLDIHVVDSQSVGPTVTAAVEMAVTIRDRGADVTTAVAALERLREKQRLLFALSSLEYLHRGGRIGGGAAFLGTMLSIKPILTVVDGKIEALDRVRTYPKALTRLIEEVAASAREWGPTSVIAAHAANPTEGQNMAERLAAITGTMPRIVEIGAVLGCHAGPGAFGIGLHPTAVIDG